jgi:pseudo-rSAM protein
VLPSEYIYIKKALIYNINTGLHVEITNKAVLFLIKLIHKKENLGVTLLKSDVLKDNDCYILIQQIVNSELLDIVEKTPNDCKPIRLMPVLNIQRDIEKLKKTDKRAIGEDALYYLSSMVIHVNSICNQKCYYCSSYHKQFTCCTSNTNHNENELDIDSVLRLIKQIEYSPLKTINIIGGNIFAYHNLQKLTESIPSNIQSHYWIHYLNLYKHNCKIIPQTSYKDIVINFPINHSLFEKEVKQLDKNTILHFIIENISHYKQIKNLIGSFDESHYDILPFYNGRNLDFFKKYVFISGEDILSGTKEQRVIFCNQAINSNFFGSLYVYSNGDVRASSSSEVIGNIRDNKLIEIISKELDINTSWRKIRDESPCASCIYKHLCPPPSNYEYAIGKYNLCHIINA